MKEQVRDGLAGFVSSSTHRQKIVAALTGGPKTASQLSEEAEMYASHVSNTLRGLEKRDLVECTTPDRKKGKLFTLTEKGRNIIAEVQIPEEYFPKALESRVASLFDELSIPYARNVNFDVRGTKITPDFVVVENFEPRLIVETKIAYPSADVSDRLEGLAFRTAELKKKMENLKAMLVLGGMGKEDWMETRIPSLLEGGYFDAVIHEEDLDPVEDRKIDFEKLVDIGTSLENRSSFSKLEKE